jgi:hypothetical protein
MRKGFETIGRATALGLAVGLWPTPALPATPPGPAPIVAAGELGSLDRLAWGLRRDLRIQQQQLDSACDFAAIRGHLIAVRDSAVAASARLERIWRAGGPHSGGFAVSEVLARDFAALVAEARRDTALADTLATLEDETRGGSDQARVLLRRMIEIHPAAPACLTGALVEPEPGDLPALRVLERVLSVDSLPDSVLVIRGVR